MKTKIILVLSALCFLGCCFCSSYAQELDLGEQKKTEGQDIQNPSDKISLDIKGMDIIDVLKILSMRANLNIVAGKNVRGKVTVFLKEVDPMDTLEIILAANDLAYEKKGDIINVMTERDYELLYGERSYDKKTVRITRLKFAKAAEVGKSLNQIKTKIGKVIVDEGSNTIVLIDVPERIEKMQEALKNLDLPTITKTFTLNYAKVKDLEEKIKSSLSKNVGEVKVDERTNRIVVTDLPEKIEYISKIISDFDEKNKVVLIEAKIVQITLNKDVGYGINWNNIFAGIDTVAQSDLSINLSGITAPTTFTYTRAHGNTDYGDRVILRVLESIGKTNVLSTPRITVANNQEAKVLVGTKEAYVTSTVTQSDGTTTTADNVQFIDVGISLSVVPTVNEDDYITMKIKPEVSAAPRSLELTNADGSIRSSIPIVTTSEAETVLSVKDGTTIIMAGLMQDTRTDNTDKIPVLGDVPLLGHFFQSKGKEDEKTELVIFLTPHVIKEGEDDFEHVQQYLHEHEKVGVKVDDKPDYQPIREAAAISRQEFSPIYSEVVAPLAQYPGEDFPQYCQYLSSKINQHLQESNLQKLQEKEIQLIFVLGADGSLKDEPFILSDLDEETQYQVIKSIERASPFAPFAGDFAQEEEIFRLTIRFKEIP